jgi:hypothetical protein
MRTGAYVTVMKRKKIKYYVSLDRVNGYMVFTSYQNSKSEYKAKEKVDCR